MGRCDRTDARKRGRLGSRQGLLPGQLVDASRQYEIAFCQSLDFVGPDFDFYHAPGQVNIRVMALLFGQFSYAVHECQRGHEVRESKRSGEMIFLLDLPAVELNEEIVNG